MRTRLYVATGLLLAVSIPVAAQAAQSSRATMPFDDARLKIEYNATEGDAGLQFFVDAEDWKQVVIANPRGRTVLDVDAGRVISNYGLTELFSESSEPPFTEFSFERFKQLFPEGRYTFTGQTIDGQRLKSMFRLSHTVPDGAVITSPADGSTLSADRVAVEWGPVVTPAGIDIVAYEVLVVADDSGLGTAERTVDVTLPATATRLDIPAEFLTPGGYKTEVLAIERNGNQTLTEVAFNVT
jgi:hypothetical protein